MTKDQATPGAHLALPMRRRGWSAPRLAELAGGVSASSIRAYMADRTIPRPDHALALARSLGPLDGKELLEGWGYMDLAHGFYEEWAAAGTDERVQRMTEAYYRFNRIEYPGEPLSDPGIKVVEALVSWIQYIEATGDTAGKPSHLRRLGPPDQKP